MTRTLRHEWEDSKACTTTLSTLFMGGPSVQLHGTDGWLNHGHASAAKPLTTRAIFPHASHPQHPGRARRELRADGKEPTRATLEALAVEGYRTHWLTEEQVRQLA